MNARRFRAKSTGFRQTLTAKGARDTADAEGIPQRNFLSRAVDMAYVGSPNELRVEAPDRELGPVDEKLRQQFSSTCTEARVRYAANTEPTRNG